jgi:hypothetical protein
LASNLDRTGLPDLSIRIELSLDCHLIHSPTAGFAVGFAMATTEIVAMAIPAMKSFICVFLLV